MKETAEDQAVTGKALENSGARLLEIVEGLEELADRMDVLKEDRKKRLAAAKSDGYDPKAIQRVIRQRAMTTEAKSKERDLFAVVGVYEAAIWEAERGPEMDGMK
ncbi:GapR family DNA-binding domain-containing protein [Stagnihabitans tardus]|uniref:DUF2312 domain-containing protein n=1 Tax=Stagnihabitans tardus TaxID=2699202 RepID=A0AAE4YDL1_9RHOB|nr:GapR family DNA-binding domain-containing protein [Stagnihabitans tardus]NBZ87925.1 DUF2312 domain-containing protein [Stagnihabitans tardus]